MKFQKYVQLREEIAVGAEVPVLRSNGQWDTGWIVTGFDLKNAKVRVAKQGVGYKDIAQDTLIQWQQHALQPQVQQPQVQQQQQVQPDNDFRADKAADQPPKGDKAAFNKWFLSKVPQGAARTPEFYIQKAMEWMKYMGVDKDADVQQTHATWYSQRVNEIMQKVKSYKGPLFRCISVENPQNAQQEINWQQVGLSWAFDERGANCYHNRAGYKIPVTIQGYISGPQAIDMDTTILYYLIPAYQKEHEFRLLRGADIQVIQGEIRWGWKNETLPLNVMAKA